LYIDEDVTSRPASSKLKLAIAVPATPPTLTADTPSIVLDALLTHASVVADVHADVMHTAISSAPVALRSTEPKLSPTTVTELPPLTAPLRSHAEPTAASKLYAALAVPATLLTVAVIRVRPPLYAAGAQVTEVADDQLVLRQKVLTSTAAVGVPRYLWAKFNPLMVRDWELLLA
jgi:hypothetical protein